jgi:hypothetical protein
MQVFCVEKVRAALRGELQPAENREVPRNERDKEKERRSLRTSLRIVRGVVYPPLQRRRGAGGRRASKRRLSVDIAKCEEAKPSVIAVK